MKTTAILFLLFISFATIAQQDTSKAEKAKTYFITETMPEFLGGPEGMARYLMTNVRYPDEAKEQGISGKTYISYVVDVDGSIADVKVAKSSHPILDVEALRVIKAMKYSAPGYQRGKPVRVQFTQPVSFNLPKPIELDAPKKKNKKNARKTINYDSSLLPMMKNPLPLLFATALLLSSCLFKKIDCDDAQTCVTNVGTDTVFYIWRCGSFFTSEQDTLLPGERTCHNVGPITVRRNWSSVVYPCFSTTVTNYQWEVNDCLVEKEID